MKQLFTRINTAAAILAAALLYFPLPAPAAESDFVGHWEGAIVTPGEPLEFDIDMSMNEDGALTGDFSVPKQQTKDKPILELHADGGDHIVLVLAKELGEPTFNGTLDGDVISGTFTQGPTSLDFNMTRKAPGPKRATAARVNNAGSRAVPDDGQFEAMPEELEIRLALSSLPLHLQKEASVYVLDPKKGYKKVISGTNGFHALVMRSVPEALKADWPFTHYPNNVYSPVGFDGAGVDAHMQPIFDLEEMRAEDVPPREAERIIMQRFADGTYKAPTRTGIAYMLSPVLSHYIPDGKGLYRENVALAVYPHYMIYASNVTDTDIGAIPGLHMFITNPGVHALMIHAASPEEVRQILEQNEQLIADLCAYKQSLCVNGPAN